MITTEVIELILRAFLIQNGLLSIKAIQSGYINQTFLLKIKGDTDRKLILQSINKDIFPDIDALMTNVSSVCHSIENCLKEKKWNNYHNLHFYQTRNGQYYFENEGVFYRLLDYVEHHTIDAENVSSQVALEAGKILARFHRLTNDMNTAEIKEIIPGFHRIDLRYDQFRKIDINGNERYGETRDFYEQVVSFEYLVKQFTEIFTRNELPIRIVHNDPKLSNILFDENQKGLTMIDLDTVMPGFLNNDFGDAIRSLTNTSDENELDLEKVGFDMALFDSFSKGYLSEVESIISDKEKKYLALFALLITFEQLIRFYGDYLNHDAYYAVSYPTHNLQRSKVQLKLLQQMSARYEDMLSSVLRTK